MRNGIYAILLMFVVWINRFFWFLPNQDKVDLKSYSIAVQAVDGKTYERLEDVEFTCHSYGNIQDIVESNYKDNICYFYNLEPETNYVVTQSSLKGLYIPEIREYMIYVNSDGSIECVSGSYIDRKGILTFKNYLAGRDFYSNNTRFWVVFGGISVVSIILLVISIILIYKLEHRN